MLNSRTAQKEDNSGLFSDPSSPIFTPPVIQSPIAKGQSSRDMRAFMRASSSFRVAADQAKKELLENGRSFNRKTPVDDRISDDDDEDNSSLESEEDNEPVEESTPYEEKLPGLFMFYPIFRM